MSFFTRIKSHKVLIVALSIGLLTFLLYAPTMRNEFIVWDDQNYVVQNPHVSGGLSWPEIIWAFTANYEANWHPLTWISHMADCQFFGLNPAGHHLTNILFHVANTLLLFFWLNRVTRKTARSALVAVFFGWHPLHVESVAWVAERKDVLCAFFWMLTLITYTRYVEFSKTHDSKIKFFYILSLFTFALSLMSKPMAVTLPFVLLLLDFWPYQRVNYSALPRLLREKIPFLALTLLDCFLTYAAQKNGGAVSNLTFIYRAENAIWAYLRYVSNTFWPADLAIIYPYKNHLPTDLIITSLILLFLWSGLFIYWRKRFPYMIVGWLWFLGTLIPAIGLVQVGSQALADRYMYIPSIGLLILIVWGAADLISFKSGLKRPVQGLAAILLIACFIITSVQITYWRNSFNLFTHAAEIIPDNAVAFFCLGNAFAEIGDRTNALIFYSQSVATDTNYYPSQLSLGKTLLEAGKYDEALPHFNRALQLDGKDVETEEAIGLAFLNSGHSQEAIAPLKFAADKIPDSGIAQNNLAAALIHEKRFSEALVHLQKAVQVEPKNILARYNLGFSLMMSSNFPAAVIQFEKVLELQPGYVNARYGLAQSFLKQENYAAAISACQETLRLNPDDLLALNELASLLATCPEAKFRDGVAAVQLASHACTLTQNHQPALLVALSAAQAETGNFPEAIAVIQNARILATTDGETNVLSQVDRLLNFYKNQKPFHGSLDGLL
jgi:protein O-mannosyl-transferase